MTVSDFLTDEEFEALSASGQVQEVPESQDFISDEEFEALQAQGVFSQLEDPTLLQSIGEGVEHGGLGLGAQVAGVPEAFSDAASGDSSLLDVLDQFSASNPIFAPLRYAAKGVAALGDTGVPSDLRSRLEAEQKELALANQPNATAFNVASSVTDALGKMAAGGGRGATALFGGGAGSEKYLELRDRGVDTDTALAAATAYGTGISQTERLGLDAALARSGSSLFSKGAGLLGASIAEGAEEAIEVPFEAAIDSLATGDEFPDLGELASEGAEAFKLGAISGGVIKTAVGATRLATDKYIQHTGHKAIDDLLKDAQDGPLLALPAPEERKALPVPEERLGLPAPESAFAKEARKRFADKGSSFPTSVIKPEILRDPSLIQQGQVVLGQLRNEQGLLGPDAPTGGEPITQEDLSRGIPQARDSRLPEQQLRNEMLRAEQGLDPYADISKGALREGTGERGRIDWGSEFGGTPIFEEAIQGVREFHRRVTESIKDGAIRRAAIASGQLRVDPRKPNKTLTEGDGYLGKALSASAFEETIAKRIPLYKDVVNTSYELEEQKHTNKAELSRNAQPYFLLNDKKRVHQFLAAQRIAQSQGKHLREDTESLRAKGWSDQEIQALRSVRDTMNKAADKIREGLLANIPKGSQDNIIQYKKAVDTLIDQHFKSALYVPFSRRGKYYVYAPDYKNEATGDTGYFSLHESRREARREEVRLIKQGLKVENGEMRPDNLREGKTIDGDEKRGTSLDVFTDLDPEVIAKLADVDSDASLALSEITGGALAGAKGNKARGFNKHLMKAKLTAGYSEDMERNIAEYLTSLSNWHAVKLSNPKYNAAIDKLSAAGKTKLAERARWRKNYMQTRKGEMQGYRRFLGLYYLTRPLSALVNGTQSVTTTQPAIAEHDGYIKAWGTYSKAMANTASYLTNKEHFAKNKELNGLLKKFSDSGLLDDQNTKELSGRAAGKVRGKAGVSIEDMLMAGFSAAESLNRHHAFFAGYDIAKRNGLKGEELEQFTKDFIRKTQFDYTKANRPEMATGKLGAPALTFRLFQGNYARFLIDRMSKAKGGDLKAFQALAASLMHMGALGGVAAFPGAREVLKAFEAEGEDPKQYIRKLPMSESWQDFLLYGGPGAFGYNVSGSIAFGDLAPDIEQGLGAAIIRIVGGVPLDIPQRVGKAAWQWLDQDNPDLAIETIAPPAMRALLQTVRWNREASKSLDPRQRGYRTSTSQYVAGEKEPSLEELIWKALGGTPTRLSKEYERLHSERLLVENYRDNEGYNSKIASAIIKGDEDRIRELVADAIEKARKVMANDSLSPLEKEVEVRKNIPQEQYIKSALKSKLLQLNPGTPKLVREQIRAVREGFGTGPEIPQP